MPKSSHRCARCGRTFSMAAHLARHQSAAHGMGGRKKGRAAKGMKKRRGRPPGRRVAARAGRISEGGEMTSRIITEMSSYLDDLNARREAINEQIAGIENAMSMLGGGRMAVPSGPAVGRRGPGRPRGRGGRGRGRRGPGRPKGSRGREGSLKPMIVQALRSSPGPLSPGEIADAVIKGGYQTKTSNLTKAVSNALPDIREVRKVGRGQYSA